MHRTITVNPDPLPGQTRVVFRRGTMREWEMANPVLSPGEPGIELNINGDRLKLGDGKTPWHELEYCNPQKLIKKMTKKPKQKKRKIRAITIIL